MTKIQELKKNKKILGIGICYPGYLTKDGLIPKSSKIKGFRNIHLRKYFTKKYNTKVIVANDADCFALGEQKMGAGKGFMNIIGIIYGTGIGSGIVMDGKIFSGSTGSAGEFGHNVVNPSGPIERSGVKGTIEAFAGGPNLVSNYIKSGGQMRDPDPIKIFKSNEPVAKRVMKDALVHLAIGLASLMNILNPEMIVIGGGQSNLPVYRNLNILTKKYTIRALKKHVRIKKNKLGDSAGVYGAAALVFNS